jgi:hypothetical protein
MLFNPSRPRILPSSEEKCFTSAASCKMLYYYRERREREREREDVVPVSSCMGVGAKECPSNTTLNVACAEWEPRSCHSAFWDYEKS